MKLHNYIWIVLLPLTIAGCSKESSSVMGGTAEGAEEITMITSALSELETKGSVVDTFSDIESLAVYAFDSNSIYIDNRSPELSSDGYWTFSPAIEWPDSGEDIGFVAYAPYIQEGSLSYNNAGFKLNAESDKIKIDYQMPTQVENHKDLLVACDMGEYGEVVELIFRHALAAVSFKVSSEQQAGLIVEGLTMTNVYDSATLTADSSGFSWSSIKLIPTVNTREYYTEYVSAPTTVGASLVSSDNYIMVIPQSIPSNICLTTTLQDGTIVTTKVSGTWAAGRLYSYVLYVDADDTGGDGGGDTGGDSSNASLSVVDVEVSAWSEVNLGDDANLGGYNPTPGTTVGGDVGDWNDNTSENLINK